MFNFDSLLPKSRHNILFNSLIMLSLSPGINEFILLPFLPDANSFLPPPDNDCSVVIFIEIQLISENKGFNTKERGITMQLEQEISEPDAKL
jgi:hypothetical protein